MFSGGFAQLEQDGFAQLGQDGRLGPDGACLQNKQVESTEASEMSKGSENVAALQQPASETGRVSEHDDTSNRSSVLDKLAGLNSDVCESSPDVLVTGLTTVQPSLDAIEQFTPVYNAADPIEEFSLETGVRDNASDGDALGEGGMAQLRAELGDLPPTTLRHDWFVSEDGFMSMHSWYRT